ncbi:glycosyltransferase [Alkalihalophilus lindianensis]|uniref:Glycosyltransferase n=1 Tax=Alkalihalophilus lindianensis TaxID=1630542 RepID=A0ABU3XCN3_9BACI|nr:glycosyltransferase [Alkalihalophilus lindianensis]MDV2685083.1 glycosyltransferase [Alkalihalophilus lindianensis]
MNKPLNVLILIKNFHITHPKHKIKMDIINAIEEFANVKYWHKDADINDVLEQLKFSPDFIFHYDIAWNYALAPKITGLDKINIPKGCYVIDLHWDNVKRLAYFKNNKIDLIFSASKNPFLKVFPKFHDKLVWLPWSINPDIIKDWKQPKTIDYLLMGLVWSEELRVKPLKGRYLFRDAVLQKMRLEKGFVFHPHPGHNAQESSSILINETYAKEINRSKMFFTCGCTSELGGFAVLKYFEVLGCNTLLLAEPNQDVLDLGFLDGENFISCNTEDFYNKAKYYLKNEEERRKIAENGHTFIQTKHTNKVRAKEFISSIQQFLKKN